MWNCNITKAHWKNHAYLHFYVSPKTCQFTAVSSWNKFYCNKTPKFILFTQIMTTMEDEELIKIYICVIPCTMLLHFMTSKHIYHSAWSVNLYLHYITTSKGMPFWHSELVCYSSSPGTSYFGCRVLWVPSHLHLYIRQMLWSHFILGILTTTYLHQK